MQTIYYGAPGTGKSHTIDTDIVSGVSDDRVFRVTFYPDFTYSDFIGQLLPKVIPSVLPGGASTITYAFQKGVFTQALEKAYENTANDVYLIIEEMSRGDCAAIFGDIFQLLDRERTGVNSGYSKYFITNELIAKDIIPLRTNGNKVKLPPNFHILGTVNTSDQNVYVMDTAFKRRFEWEYVSTDPVLDSPVGVTPVVYKNNVQLSIHDGSTLKPISWVELYQKLNDFIADDGYLGLGEDKQLGPFFIEFDTTPGADHKKQVKNKLLHYLWSDVHKASYKSDVRLFKDDLSTFKKLYEAFERDEQIFSTDFLNTL